MFHQVDLVRPGLLGKNKGQFQYGAFDKGGECKLPRQLSLALHHFVMVRRTKAQVMSELPKLTRLLRYVPVQKAHRQQLLDRYGAAADGTSFDRHEAAAIERAARADLGLVDGEVNGGAGGAGVGGSEADGSGGCSSGGASLDSSDTGDRLRDAGIKATPQRVGLLKAIALNAERDSWLRERLKALRYGAEEYARAATADEPPRKLVVFGHHQLVLDLLGEIAADVLGSPAAFVRIDGRSDGQTKNQLIDQFVTRPTVLLAIVSITAAGVGVNGFQDVADEAIFVELPSDPRWMEQAEARVWRPRSREGDRLGSQHPVTIVYLLADLDTPSRDPMHGGASQRSEEAGLLQECRHADVRSWGRLCRNCEDIRSVVSGDVQRDVTAAAAAAAAAAGSTADTHSDVVGGSSAARGSGDVSTAPAPLQPSASGAFRFAVSVHTRRVHVYSEEVGGPPSGTSFSTMELSRLLPKLPSPPNQANGGGVQDGAAEEEASTVGALGREGEDTNCLEMQAAAFLRAWQAQPVRVRLRLHGLPSTVAAFPQLCASVQEQLRELREASTKRRSAPLLLPTAQESSSLPRGAVWIRAVVEQGIIRGNAAQLAHHWQPFVPPAPLAQSGGVLLCCECFSSLESSAATGRENATRTGDGCDQEAASAELPEGAELGWSVRHREKGLLFCGGRCMREWRVRREPVAVRRELRKQHVMAHGSVHCQTCGVDCIALATQVRK